MTNLPKRKINGIVVKGLGEGRKIGIPTANIETSDNLKDLTQGVYAVFVYLSGQKLKGVAHYGPRAVFGENSPVLEVHILDFYEDIYGEHLNVEILEFIRPTVKFDSMEEMLEEIKRDKVKANSILNNYLNADVK